MLILTRLRAFQPRNWVTPHSICRKVRQSQTEESNKLLIVRADCPISGSRLYAPVGGDGRWHVLSGTLNRCSEKKQRQVFVRAVLERFRILITVSMLANKVRQRAGDINIPPRRHSHEGTTRSQEKDDRWIALSESLFLIRQGSKYSNGKRIPVTLETYVMKLTVVGRQISRSSDRCD